MADFIHGVTLTEDPDAIRRLTRLLDRVERYTSNGAWVSLSQLADACGGTEASVSARLRDLRKKGYIVDRRHVGRGLYHYRVHWED